MTTRGRLKRSMGRAFHIVVAVLLVTMGLPGCGDETSGKSTVDTTPDQTTSEDSAAEDAVQTLDVGQGDGALNCPGGPQCPCTANNECDNGFCIDAPAGKRCATMCESGGCGPDYTCAKVNSSSGDIFSVCVPRWGYLCEPCTATKQCEEALAVSGAACIDYGDSVGSFCGASCQVDGDCPSNYSCMDATTIEGKPARQCRLKQAGSEPAVCGCDPRAIQLKLTTSCKVSAELGTCQGFRQCGDAGLGACSAPKATSETCDNIDNDCNGLTDENLCDDKNVCTDDQCISATKSCQNTVNTAACSDGSACTEKDVCATGKCAGITIDCDDKNVCTTDICDAEKGCVHNPIAGECNDGDDCTVGDNCQAGACTGGKPKDCDDGNPCTQDGCDIASGKCAPKILDGSPCSDGNACTTPDLCVGDVCKGGPVDCNDKNPCTDDACDPGTASNPGKGCVNTPNTLACDDGNACTKADSCDGKGGCAGLAIDVSLTCNDNNICTSDVCDQGSGCVNTPLAGPCDDGDPCTNGDQCTVGKCKAGASICSCQTDADCIPSEDGNLCNGTLYCDKAKAPYVCVVDPKTIPAPCDASQNNACQVNECVKASGKCAFSKANNGKPCNADDSVCTKDDACGDGQCVAGAKIPCDDGNPCTDDLCDPKDGCKNVANISPCEDGNKCTVGDTCGSAACVPGKLTVCDDGSECTSDSCNPASGLCKFDTTAFEGSPCDADKSVCTVGDKCVSGKCTAGNAKICNDSELCTTDSCDPLKGCVHDNNTLPCEYDNNACTPFDVCKGGTCTLGAKKDCDDKNQCTIDSCAAGVCKYDAIALEGGNCDDGDKCTENDLCKSGTCTAGAKVNCDDADTCTTDGCVPASGCTHVTLADNSPCNDGNACTIKDICVVGNCGGIKLQCDDANPCTNDICGAVGCEHTNVADTTGCGVGQWCVGGTCKTKGCGDAYVDASVGEQCDDGNAAACDGCEGCKTRGILLLDGKSYASAAVTPTVPQTFKGDLGLAGDLTIEAWIRPDTLTTAQTIVAKAKIGPPAQTAWEFGLAATTGKLTFYHLGPEGGEQLTGTTALSVGKWTHVAVVIAGDVLRFYVNGAQAGGGTLAKTRADSPGTSVVFGRRYADLDYYNFSGAIDAVRLSAAPLYGGAFVPVRTPTATPETRAIWLFDDPTAGMGNSLFSSDAGPYGNTANLAATAKLGADGCYGAAATAALCGDGNVASPFEACDDKNADSCDGCNGCQMTRAFDAGGVNSALAPVLSTWANDLFCPTCEFTAEAWVRLDKQVATPSEIVASTCGLFTLMVFNGKFAVVRGTNPPLFSANTVDIGKWYHVAAVANWSAGSELRLYVDGVLQTPGTGMVGTLDANALKEQWLIGAGASHCVAKAEPANLRNFFPGLIDEVRVSQGSRYTDNFVPPRRVWPDRQTRGLWRFDEPATATVFADDSGNNVALTATSAKWIADACWGQGTASQCGDGQPAKYEACDNGASNGAPPKLCSAVCAAKADNDCTTMNYTGGGQIYWNIMEYNTASWTIDGWVKIPALPASGTGWIVGVGDSSSGCGMPLGQEWYIGVTADGSDASVLGGQTQIISPTKKVWRTGVWQHFALQYEGFNRGSLWVDGVKVRTFTNVSTAWGPSCPLLVGNGVNGKALGGSMASLRLSGKVRYGQPFVPAWKLPDDASAKWLFEFLDPGVGATQVLSTNTKYYLKFKTVTPTFGADGPQCK